MYYLIIDTCTWINLAKKYTELRQKITSLIEQGKVRLIVPQIIIQEWNKHKQDKIIESKKLSIQGMVKNAKYISQYLEHDKSEQFKTLLADFQNQVDEIENMASEEVKAIDLLFDDVSTIKLPIDDSIKLQAVELALSKKAPFREKNSMADALILLATINYLSNNSLNNSIFVSENTGDFSSANDKNKPHEDLYDLFDKNKVKYFINIGLALSEIEEDLISSQEINEIEEELEADIAHKAFENYHQAAIPILEILQKQQQYIEEALKNPFIERMHEQQRQFEELLRNPVLETLSEQHRQIDGLSISPIIERMYEQQRQFRELLKNPLIKRIFERQSLLEKSDNNSDVNGEI